MAQATRTQTVTEQPAKPDRYVTLEEYMRAYSKQPVEVVNGEFVKMSPTQRGHSAVLRRLFRTLDSFVMENNLGEVWMETSYVLDGQPRTQWVSGVRQPDVSFITRERVDAHNAEHGESEGPWWLAPDLAVEIVSPTDSYTEVSQKIADYLRFGVRLVWVIDPQMRTVRVFTQDDHEGRTLHDDDTLSGGPVVERWSMDIGELFGKKASEGEAEQANRS